MNTNDLISLCKRIRHSIITVTTCAMSGHPTSSLSAVELMATLFFGGFFHFDQNNPHSLANDRIIFSKGHAAPLLYALYEAAGLISQKELLTLRSFSSRLQGHPTPEFPFVDVATGSLGQGLSVGVGMVMGMKLKVESQKSKVFVLLGDSEMAEGQVWEALQLASYYQLNNLVGILDVNRLGQRGETMVGWDLKTYERRISSFGWNTIVLEDGHDIDKIYAAFQQAAQSESSPTMIIAKTVKGKGISFLENQEGWHGKALTKEQEKEALSMLGNIDWSVKGEIKKPSTLSNIRTAGLPITQVEVPFTSTTHGASLSTREAYGITLAELAKQNPHIISLDAETSNSTFAEKVKKETPEQFLEMYIAEQNMVSVALGLSKFGYIPFVSSFAAFLTRSFDQIRMSQYSFAIGDLDGGIPTRAQSDGYRRALTGGNPRQNLSQNKIIIVGSHSGCSIGEDGASQMGLEDIAMMRSIRESTVLYPSDAVSAAKLTPLLALQPGISYLRLTREKTPIIYQMDEEFKIGGSKIHFPTTKKQSEETTHYATVIIAAGITVHEALKAQKKLAEKGTGVVVVDLYSIQPLDQKTISELAKQTKHIIVVEDHYSAGGIGEAIATCISQLAVQTQFTHLCVRKTPRSGTPKELLSYEEIDAEAIYRSVQKNLTIA